MSETDDPRPIEPIQPDIDDCCGRGCFPCVFDRYDDAMDAYKLRLKEWETRHATAPKSLLSRLRKSKAT